MARPFLVFKQSLYRGDITDYLVCAIRDASLVINGTGEAVAGFRLCEGRRSVKLLVYVASHEATGETYNLKACI